MKKELSPWSKSVKHAMIDRNMSMVELAKAVGMAREYTSAVVNGRVDPEPAKRKISDFLNIPYASTSN